jgi:ABC-type phosphate/phosphonate transport system substrate-binding protein
MFGHITRPLPLALCALGVGSLALSMSSGSETGARPAQPIQIGLVKTLADQSTSARRLVTHLFGALVKQQTGVDARVTIAGDAFDLGRRLEEKKYQLGFFYGVEFAWAQQEYHDLRPLVTVISKYHAWHARLVVSKDNEAADLAALKGKSLALPQRYRPHCRLFLEKACASSCRAEPAACFGHITYPASTEDALDSVLTGDSQATVVDDSAMDHYKEIKPGCFARLRVVQESEPFPPGVIAYRQDGLDRDTLARLRTGLMNASKAVSAREGMALVGVTNFEPVPADFGDRLARIAKAYPPKRPKTR